METEITQPAILATSIAALQLLQGRGLRCDITAGLSLGEYTALVASGALDLEQALPLVRARGRFMQEAAAGRATAMAAILGMEAAEVTAICRRASAGGVVQPANFNGPGQTVIAGEAGAVEEAIALAKAAGAKRAVRLSVSAPFHTALMQPAAERLAPLVEELPLREPAVPIVSNVTAKPTRAPAEIKPLLIAQVASPVRWDESVRAMSDMGVLTFVEVGPGSTLSGLIRKIAPGARTLRVEDPQTLDETLAALGQPAQAHGKA
jgi:[acyl-carrier-protein] S-malonyltransferase